MIRSYFPGKSYSRKSPFIKFIRSAQGEAEMLAAASSAESSSISRASMVACKKRWAIIRASSPHPVPISSILEGPSPG